MEIVVSDVYRIAALQLESVPMVREEMLANTYLCWFERGKADPVMKRFDSGDLKLDVKVYSRKVKEIKMRLTELRKQAAIDKYATDRKV